MSTSVPTGSFSTVDAAIAEIAARQYGLVTAAQLAALGLTTSGVTKRAQRGVLHRVHRGVYSLSPSLSHDARCLAAVLAANGAALSHFAATNHWNLRRSGLITVVSRKRVRVRGVIAHQRDLRDADVTVLRGIPVTTVARTLVDLNGVMTPHGLANVIHEADFRRRFSLEATLAAMAGRRGLGVLRRALALNAAGSAGTKSPHEDAFLALVQDAGYPEPLVNVKHLGFEIDFRWPERALAVEVDGGHHQRARTRTEDARRDRALEAAGYTVLRFADVELGQRPADVLSALARAW